jgi:hypothetical protein
VEGVNRFLGSIVFFEYFLWVPRCAGSPSAKKKFSKFSYKMALEKLQVSLLAQKNAGKWACQANVIYVWEARAANIV